jgi:hypothetical protein
MGLLFVLRSLHVGQKVVVEKVVVVENGEGCVPLVMYRVASGSGSGGGFTDLLWEGDTYKNTSVEQQ